MTVPTVRVYCAACGDEIDDPQVDVEDDGTISVTVSGVCQREHQQALEHASWSHDLELKRHQEQTARERRAEQQRYETETFLRDERERKEKQDRDFRRLLGR